MQSNRRVVVTGLGMLTPLGLSVKETWNNILQGKSGASIITHFDPSRLPVQINAAVPGFNPDDYLPPKESRKIDQFVQYAYVATKQAIEDSGLVIDEKNSHRIGAAIGAGIGGLPLIEKNHSALLDGGPRRVSPFFIPSSIINMSAGFASIHFNLKGPNISIVTACTTGAHNLGVAARMVAYGDADVMIAGGVEMATTELAIAGFAQARALSARNDAPEKASRPWDKDRDGFLMGEGAGLMVLEEYEHAVKRGAKIYAEFLGFGMSADAYHITTPGEDGGLLSMQSALRDAEINPDQVHYINAHATSTSVGDLAETIAIKKAFGDAAYNIPVSSTKSMTGHLLGATGSVEAMFCVLALRDQVAPPTINLDNPDEGCDLDYVPHHARPMKMDIALSNSFGFGGTNGTLVFKRV